MRTVLKALVVLVVLALFAAYTGYRFWQVKLEAPIAVDEQIIYEVPQGAGFNRVIAELESRGILSNSWAFKLLARIEPQRVHSLKPGEYMLQPEMSGLDVLDKLNSGDVVTYKVTIPEGWSFKQMRAVLDDAEKLSHDTVDMSDEDLMAELGYEGEHPEGRFFPDTYTYYKGVSDEQILRQSLRRMDRLLDDAWAKRDEGLPYETPYEALIMASLIEKETGAPQERREIAGVFVRRLERGMRLQTDPTVIYGMGDRYDGNITRADLRKKTPYNTYVIEGLPPTPIALPGKASLEAAMHPAEGETLYFVAKGDGTGTHHFSRTLREHNEAVRRYILKR